MRSKIGINGLGQQISLNNFYYNHFHLKTSILTGLTLVTSGRENYYVGFVRICSGPEATVNNYIIIHS